MFRTRLKINCIHNFFIQMIIKKVPIFFFFIKIIHLYGQKIRLQFFSNIIQGIRFFFHFANYFMRVRQLKSIYSAPFKSENCFICFKSAFNIKQHNNSQVYSLKRFPGFPQLPDTLYINIKFICYLIKYIGNYQIKNISTVHTHNIECNKFRNEGQKNNSA